MKLRPFEGVMAISKSNIFILTCLIHGLSFFYTAQAQAQAAPCDPTLNVCVNQPCDALGVSQIDKDAKNIIICLNPETGLQKI